ncbi:MAG: hypothetical protein MAG451_02732 [Anaerolineales bacterium]|nr:hypothetical protein [Anaerolineales bacterium]
MDTYAKQSFIRRIAEENRSDPEGTRVVWSAHAVIELVAEELTRQEIEEALEACDVIEDYPTLHRPLPDCLVLGYLDDDHPVHVVVAIDTDQDRILIVTVYQPSEQEWEDDWRTRKT